jgi:hypothetical protein
MWDVVPDDMGLGNSVELAMSSSSCQFNYFIFACVIHIYIYI